MGKQPKIYTAKELYEIQENDPQKLAEINSGIITGYHSLNKRGYTYDPIINGTEIKGFFIEIVKVNSSTYDIILIDQAGYGVMAPVSKNAYFKLEHIRSTQSAMSRVP